METLSPAQIERLSKLLEECAETTQIASKILRFGYTSTFQGKSNIQRLEEEICDILLAIKLMKQEGDITTAGISAYESQKIEKLNTFLKYNKVNHG